GNPVSGVSVTFAVASGGGTVDPTTAILTDAGGIAQVTSWTLGPTAGTNTLTATAGTLSGSPVTFTATGTAGTATTIALNGGDAQTDTAGATLATPYTVLVTDGFGNPKSGITVTWAVTGGGGSITPSSATNASGIASATRVLGTTAGTQTATATVSGLTGSPVSFSSTATTGTAATIALSGGNAQTDTAGATLATPYTVLVADGFGNPKSGITVTWAVTGGGGSITPSSATNASGIASATRVLGTASGTQTATATVTGLSGSPVSFTTTATTGTAATIALNGGNAQTDTVAATLPVPYTVLVTDGFGNPKSGITVTWGVTGGGGSITPSSATNGSGIASATRVLGTLAGTQTATAAVTGLTGSPVSFTATATHGVANQLAVNAGNNQSATVNTAVPIPPAVIVRDQFTNPVSGISVTFAV
ncbi:MAG: Ig-like domain-containing protein, partial [Gemmatimonadetes bacterium]|nr:Ig-like domain-containing protein [Gemmatimonadota bacterium]